MISKTPTKAVLRALDVQCKMFEDDLKLCRTGLTEDTRSILNFQQFVRMAKEGNVGRCSAYLPLDHIEFYKETISRLVHAGELPASTIDRFDYAFSLKG